MGLLERFKKPRDGASGLFGKKQDTEASGSPFRGDLAILGNTIAASPDPAHENPEPPANPDSADSVVFLSFPAGELRGWICPECGTRNSKELDCCIVCGLKH